MLVDLNFFVYRKSAAFAHQTNMSSASLLVAAMPQLTENHVMNVLNAKTWTPLMKLPAASCVVSRVRSFSYRSKLRGIYPERLNMFLTKANFNNDLSLSLLADLPSRIQAHIKVHYIFF
jgi:hypothetical protein